MAIALVQHKPADDGGVSSANGSVTGLTACTAGNLGILAAGFNLIASAVTDPSGWSRRGFKDDGGNKTTLIASFILAGGETSFAFTHALASWAIEFFEFSGNAGSGSEFDAASAGGNGTSLTSLQPGSLTPAVTNELFIAACRQGSDNGGSEAINSSFNIMDNAFFSKFIAAYKIKTDAAAENPTMSWLTARNASAIQAAFKPGGTSIEHSFGSGVGISLPTTGAISHGSEV